MKPNINALPVIIIVVIFNIFVIVIYNSCEITYYGEKTEKEYLHSIDSTLKVMSKHTEVIAHYYNGGYEENPNDNMPAKDYPWHDLHDDFK